MLFDQDKYLKIYDLLQRSNLSIYSGLYTTLGQYWTILWDENMQAHT